MITAVSFDDRVTDIVDTFGYAGVALLVAVESLFPPIPSELILPLAGFSAGDGKASTIGMIAAATAGSVLGSWMLYFLAQIIGPNRVHRIVARHQRWTRISNRDLERAELWFDRRADMAVLLGRCVPLIRSLVSIPAGYRKMNIVRFTLLTAIGSAIWNTALIGAGAVLGERWHEVGNIVGLLQGIVVILIIVGIGLILWRRVLKPRLARAGDLPPD